MSIALQELVSFLDDSLQIKNVSDYPNAFNGLQLENNGQVSKIALAVDGSELAIRIAIAQNADFLLLHHGIFWQSMQPITGIAYRKLKTAMDANLAIYSAHLPLDIHPTYGNNIILAKACGLNMEEVEFSSRPLGVTGHFAGSCSELSQCLEAFIETPVQAYWKNESEAPAGKVFICSGGGGDELAQIASLGCQTFITGEGSHWNIPLANELGINLIYGGHYFTETCGLRSLSNALSERFGISVVFLNLPPSAYSFPNLPNP